MCVCALSQACNIECLAIPVCVQEAAHASQGFMQLPDVYINQANVQLARGDATGAILLYQQAGKAYHNKNPRVSISKRHVSCCCFGV